MRVPSDPLRFVRSWTSDIVHILTGYASDPDGGYRNLARTACNRSIKHGQSFARFSHMGHYRLCTQCGSVEDFRTVRDTLLRYGVEESRSQKDFAAEAVAEESWAALGTSLDEGIMDDIQRLVDAGNVFVPFSKSGLAFLRIILKRYIANIEKQELKSDALVKDWYKATDMLEFLDSYGD